MSADAIEALQSVREYLNEKLLAAVPAGMKSDVRAAAKLMENALAELDAAYPTLSAECDDMARLCRAAAEVNIKDEALQRIAASAATLANNAPAASWRLQELSARHAEWCALVGDLALALQRVADGGEAPGNRAAAALLSRLLETLGQHAHVHSAWQSVFPTGKPFADILVER